MDRWRQAAARTVRGARAIRDVGLAAASMSVAPGAARPRRPDGTSRVASPRRAAPDRARGLGVRRVLDDPSLVTPVFQPIVSVLTGETVGHEALARLALDPEHAPVGLFRDARAVGLGSEIEALAVRRALDVAASAGLPDGTFVSVNISPLALDHADVWEVFRSRDLRQVVIELTEDDAVDDYRTLRRVMRRFTDRGARFAIDDAGAGFASMRHLTELWPAFFKLDALLTRGLRRDVRRQALVRALSTLAGDVDATLIVEGVEHVEDLRHLARAGLPILVQGYSVARPSAPWAGISKVARGAIDPEAR